MARRNDSDPDKPARSTDDRAIIEEGRRRFKRAQEVEAIARDRFMKDIKFANGDAYNNYQWPDKVYTDRTNQNRPAMTINKVRQHNLQIINDARQNKTAIKIVATGDGATYESAQVYSAICRHIEYISNAQQIYTTATRFQVQGGIGYWRLETDWADDESFDQEIFIRPVKNPLSIYLDPDILEADGSDARFAFVFEEMAPDEFKVLYPDYAHIADRAPLGQDDDWCRSDCIRVAEYWRKSDVPDWLVAYEEGRDEATGAPLMKIERASEMPPGKMELLMKLPTTQRRRLTGSKVERFKIAGDEVIAKTLWLGRYIPIVRVPGEETRIDGQLDRKGHTRAMLDAQRNYNFWTSEAASQVALQAKVPYMAPIAAISGYETVWANANTSNPAILPYKHLDEDGKEIPKPERTQPPVMASGYIQGMQIAQEELRMASGQYQAEMGAPGNEKSGVAITARQRQADNATYHYVDHLAMAIRFTGKILLDLIPKVYDTPRVRRIMAEDGTESDVTIDVAAPDALARPEGQRSSGKGEAIMSIFNPKVGKYDVEADVGPGFATKRQEAFNAFTQIAAQNKEFMQIGGDLMWSAADFPKADILAERWRRFIAATNPSVLGEGPTPQEQQLQQQLEQLQQVIAANGEQMQEMERKLRDQSADIAEKAEHVQIDAFDAETRRVAAIKDALGMAPDELRMLVVKTIRDAMISPDVAPEPVPELENAGMVPAPPMPPQAPPMPEETAPPMPPMMPPGQ